MKILAIDTSGDFCTVALNCDGSVDARQSPRGVQHSAVVLPMVHALLADAGFRITDLDAIAFGEGPGSFTGLRIACGVTQPRPVVEKVLPQLDAMIVAEPEDSDYFAMSLLDDENALIKFVDNSTGSTADPDVSSIQNIFRNLPLTGTTKTNPA